MTPARASPSSPARSRSWPPETARASADITRRVEAIQADSVAAAEAIRSIDEVISRISDYQSSIAGAVEEQTATTAEMSRSVRAAADGAGGIAASIEVVARSSARTRGRRRPGAAGRRRAERRWRTS